MPNKCLISQHYTRQQITHHAIKEATSPHDHIREQTTHRDITTGHLFVFNAMHKPSSQAQRYRWATGELGQLELGSGAGLELGWCCIVLELELGVGWARAELELGCRWSWGRALWQSAAAELKLPYSLSAAPSAPCQIAAVRPHNAPPPPKRTKTKTKTNNPQTS